jgi:hypothetical protein
MRNVVIVVVLCLGISGGILAGRHSEPKSVTRPTIHIGSLIPKDISDTRPCDDKFALGNSIGKPQDKTDVKTGAYGPKSWWEYEDETSRLRKGLLNIIASGQGVAIPVAVAYDQIVQQQIATIGEQSKAAQLGE